MDCLQYSDESNPFEQNRQPVLKVHPIAPISSAIHGLLLCRQADLLPLASLEVPRSFAASDNESAFIRKENHQRIKILPHDGISELMPLQSLFW
jgi:hypothetical protein